MGKNGDIQSLQERSIKYIFQEHIMLLKSEESWWISFQFTKMWLNMTHFPSPQITWLKANNLPTYSYSLTNTATFILAK